MNPSWPSGLLLITNHSFGFRDSNSVGCYTLSLRRPHFRYPVYDFSASYDSDNEPFPWLSLTGQVLLLISFFSRARRDGLYNSLMGFSFSFVPGLIVRADLRL